MRIFSPQAEKKFNCNVELSKIDLRISLALPAFLPSAFFHHFILFFCQNKEVPRDKQVKAMKENVVHTVI